MLRGPASPRASRGTHSAFQNAMGGWDPSCVTSARSAAVVCIHVTLRSGLEKGERVSRAFGETFSVPMVLSNAHDEAAPDGRYIHRRYAEERDGVVHSATQRNADKNLVKDAPACASAARGKATCWRGGRGLRLTVAPANASARGFRPQSRRARRTRSARRWKQTRPRTRRADQPAGVQRGVPMPARLDARARPHSTCTAGSSGRTASR